MADGMKLEDLLKPENRWKAVKIVRAIGMCFVPPDYDDDCFSDCVIAGTEEFLEELQRLVKGS